MAKMQQKTLMWRVSNFFKIKKHLDTWMRFFLGKSALKPRANGMPGSVFSNSGLRLLTISGVCDPGALGELERMLLIFILCL